MNVYRDKRRLTINAEYARTPTEALEHVTKQAADVFGNARLISCEIKASEFVVNAWDVEATFEQEVTFEQEGSP